MIPSWFKLPVKSIDANLLESARKRQAQLAKPVGALGMLEQMAVRMAAMQGRVGPLLERAKIVVFVADHGIAQLKISAFPQSMTLDKLRLLSSGESAINVMARTLQAELEIVNVGTAIDPGPLPGIIDARAAHGTADIRFTPAMDERQFSQAMEVGREAVLRAHADQTDIFIGGEIAIGGSTATAAVACAMLGLAPEAVAGPGSGVNAEGLALKVQVIHGALEHHAASLNTPCETMRCLGGLEMVALCAAYITCAQVGIPALVDGFTACTAAMIAIAAKPAVKDWLFFAHRSAEPGQLPILRSLDVHPILYLDLYLGEGSGAAAALPLLRLACDLQRHMAVFPNHSPTCRDLKAC